MASELAPIKTPLAQQWKRIRYQLMPVMTLAVAMAATAFLWSRHATPMSGWGEIFTLKFNAVSHRNGMLIALPKPLQEYDRVDEGQTVAMFDDAPVVAQFALLQSEVKRLQLELPGNQAPMQLSERNKLSVHVESLKLDLLDRRAQIELDKLAFQRAQFTAAPTTRPAAGPLIKASETAVADMQGQLKGSLDKLRAIVVNPADSIENFLAPIRAQIAQHEAKLQELAMHAQALRVVAPIAGRIIDIHRRPGQGVQSGDPIVTIASDAGQQVVTYVRQEQRVTPEIGMPVEIRLRDGSLRRAPLVSTIERVGPQLEPIPAHLLRDAKIPEWGRPVMISLPAGVTRTPGEIVDIKFGANNAVAMGG